MGDLHPTRSQGGLARMKAFWTAVKIGMESPWRAQASPHTTVMCLRQWLGWVYQLIYLEAGVFPRRFDADDPPPRGIHCEVQWSQCNTQ